TRLVVIGSGNLAWHIVSHLSFFRRFEILVYSRTLSPHLIQLEKEFKISITTHWNQVPADADYYFICTGDEAIKQVALKFKKLKTQGLVLHTSGTSALSVVSKASKHYGVFYPLQTFTFGKSVNWSEVPLFIEANTTKALFNLERLANLFSKTVVHMSSPDRLKLHLAAVIAGNFSNAMYASARAYLSSELDEKQFDYLIPLILQTAKKIRSAEPALVQTGPAARKDKHTQKKHIELLKRHVELKKIYKSISKLIAKQQKTNVKL
ncbi:MAG: Rossmann-like and DUF2520 domain-containing protein, partial [Bacteroidia bacterium]